MVVPSTTLSSLAGTSTTVSDASKTKNWMEKWVNSTEIVHHRARNGSPDLSFIMWYIQLCLLLVCSALVWIKVPKSRLKVHEIEHFLRFYRKKVEEKNDSTHSCCFRYSPGSWLGNKHSDTSENFQNIFPDRLNSRYFMYLYLPQHHISALHWRVARGAAQILCIVRSRWITLKVMVKIGAELTSIQR